MAQRFPAVAAHVAKAMVGHVVQQTAKSYASVTRNYEAFCCDFDVEPYPVDELWLCAWLLRLSSSVKHTSMRVYLAGVQFEHVNNGFCWELRGSEMVRRMLRYIKRVCPVQEEYLKVPISIGLLKRILPLLPGWPCPDRMCHADRLFAAASLIGVGCFLRGGEFLASPNSYRPILPASSIREAMVGDETALVVRVPQPKTSWWLTAVDVPCFAPAEPALAVFSPLLWWRAYIRLSPFAGSVAFSPECAAFHTASGVPLSRATMVGRTTRLMEQAGVAFVDSMGRKLAVRSASWRAGGVRSAKDAGVAEAEIRALGRWKSSAWVAYLLHTCLDLQGAARSMWRASVVCDDSVRGLRVGDRGAEDVFAVGEADVVDSVRQRLRISQMQMRRAC